ncbi:MAG: hypothetical protein MRY79_01640 [Alphaproteobacteria bacterium]|nr:hypothetical protein [Alphaproteobacteria bacterium]
MSKQPEKNTNPFAGYDAGPAMLGGIFVGAVCCVAAGSFPPAEMTEAKMAAFALGGFFAGAAIDPLTITVGHYYKKFSDARKLTNG